MPTKDKQEEIKQQIDQRESRRQDWKTRLQKQEEDAQVEYDQCVDQLRIELGLEKTFDISSKEFDVSSYVCQAATEMGLNLEVRGDPFKRMSVFTRIKAVKHKLDTRKRLKEKREKEAKLKNELVLSGLSKEAINALMEVIDK